MVSHPAGVYAVRGVPPSWEQSVQAAVLAVGGPAWASHATAARLWEFDGFAAETPEAIEVTVPLTRVARLPGIRAHRSGTLVESDLREVDGIPTLCPARTLVDVSARVDEARLGSLVDDGLRRRVVTLSALHAVARRLPTIAPGRSPKVVARVLAARTAGYHPGDSELETHVYRVLVASGLAPPVRQYRVVINGRVYVVDLAYPAVRLGIEVDGFAFHRDRTAFDADRVRQNDFVRAGWSMLRFTSRSTNEEIVGTVRPFLFVR